MDKPKLTGNLVVVDHPLVLHKLTLMRDKHTPSAVFRQLLREISLLLAYEVARDLPMTTQTIETPLAEMEAPILKGKKLVIVSILRAGNGLLEGMLDLMPSARVGHIGIYRNPETLQPVEYYMKVPEDISERRCDRRRSHARDGQFGIRRHQAAQGEGCPRHQACLPPLRSRGRQTCLGRSSRCPDIYGCSRQPLEQHGYIVPGLGDAGDRMFGTK